MVYGEWGVGDTSQGGWVYGGEYEECVGLVDELGCRHCEDAAEVGQAVWDVLMNRTGLDGMGQTQDDAGKRVHRNFSEAAHRQGEGHDNKERENLHWVQA